MGCLAHLFDSRIFVAGLKDIVLAVACYQLYREVEFPLVVTIVTDNLFSSYLTRWVEILDEALVGGVVHASNNNSIRWNSESGENVHDFL